MSLKDTYICAWENLPLTLASGSALSDPINLAGLRLFSLFIPDSWTAANLTFQASPDGGATWANLYDRNGNELVAIATPGTCVLLDPQQFAAMPFLKIRSGTASSPVAQTADRALQLILRTI